MIIVNTPRFGKLVWYFELTVYKHTSLYLVLSAIRTHLFSYLLIKFDGNIE